MTAKALSKLKKGEGSTMVDAVDGELKNRQIGVVNAEIIRQSLNPPYTSPNARVPVMVDGTLYHSPVRTAIRQKLTFVDEDIVEAMDEYRQVIPFIILYDADHKRFLIRKINKVTDIHPTDHLTIGMFGHINGGEGIYEALYRIVEERTSVKSKDIGTCVFNGYIYDNPHHIGLVFIARISPDVVKMQDSTYSWVTYEDIGKYVGDGIMDGWSKISYEHILTRRRASGTI